MTVPTAPVNSSVNRAEQLEQLRKQMAAVSSKVGAKRHAELDFRAVALPAESLLPIPDSLVELLPAGARPPTQGVARHLYISTRTTAAPPRRRVRQR